MCVLVLVFLLVRLNIMGIVLFILCVDIWVKVINGLILYFIVVLCIMLINEVMVFLFVGMSGVYYSNLYLFFVGCKVLFVLVV